MVNLSNIARRREYIRSDVDLDTLTLADVTVPAGHANEAFAMIDFGDHADEHDIASTLTEDQQTYRRDGVLILRNFVPEERIDAYLTLRDELGAGHGHLEPLGDEMKYQPVQDLLCYPALMNKLNELHSCQMGHVLTLSKFTSTQRGWHSDAYFDRHVSVPRAACWFALGDVGPDCGPFQYILGSHRWGQITTAKMNALMVDDFQYPLGPKKKRGVPKWGRVTEEILHPIVEAEIKSRDATVEDFIAQKGDVLIWYGHTIHRGTSPEDDQSTRPAIIAHYLPIFRQGRGFFARTEEGAFFERS